MHPRIFSEGQSFGRLKIICAYAEKRSVWYHEVECDCGTKKFVAGRDLSSGSVRSCGCFRDEFFTKHGLSKSCEYRIWAGIKQRCLNKKDSAYKNYGGRGIALDEKWNEFDQFIKDMGERPSKSHSIERVDNNKGYSKENCVWADRFSQNINQRLRKDNKTGVKGVSYNRISGRYTAKIQRNKKQRYLGSFRTFDEAVQARKQAEVEGY